MGLGLDGSGDIVSVAVVEFKFEMGLSLPHNESNELRFDWFEVIGLGNIHQVVGQGIMFEGFVFDSIEGVL